MTHYTISSSDFNSRWINISININDINSDFLELQLPSWRPGRYELGNFAKNVSGFYAVGKNGRLNFEKITKDRWKIETKDEVGIIVVYKYYSVDWNAGSTYVCNEFLYVNPVNCLMYADVNEECQLSLVVPSSFELAIGKEFNKSPLGKTSIGNDKEFVVIFDNFHDLADSPFIAGNTLQERNYTIDGTVFHVWFNGECKPDWDKVLRDFEKFTKRQIQSYGKFTCKEYHFYIHALPFAFYHGVEHLTSSVNALGPSYAVTEERYTDLLGLCSHELYHSWNIKSIRPAEMYPYNYEKENYFRTGFVAEGVTTYMGDLMLYASDVFDQSQFFSELSQQLQKHFDNAGRNNYSVADSGFDTWLDGYVPGVPDRKVSIYTEGCLIALICDILILENSKGKNTLDDVMRDLYNDFALKGKGYTESDYRNLIEKYVGRNLPEVFDDLVNGTKSYLPLLENSLAKLKLKINKVVSPVISERKYGMKLTETPDKTLITSIYSGSPASKALQVNDQIISINSMAVRGDANRWLNYYEKDKKIVMMIFRAGKLFEVWMYGDEKTYYDIYILEADTDFPNELARRWKER